MNDPAQRPAIRITTPEALVASLPYLVGFLPLESLIAVFVSSPPRTIVVTMRLDLPKGNDVAEVTAALRGAIVRARSHADIDLVHLVAWTSDITASAPMAVVRDLSAVCAAESLEVAQGMVTDGERWLAVDTGSLGSVSASPGVAGEVAADDDALLAQCQLVGAGLGYLPSRDHLVDALAPTSEPLPWDSVVGALMNKADAERCGQGAAWRRRSEDQLVDWLTAEAEPEKVPVRAARWMAALRDCRVREPVMHRVLVGKDRDTFGRVRGRLALLVRKAPREAVAPVAAVLAACAWQDGDGAAALVAAGRALEAEPENCLAQLIATAAGSGLPPGEWVRVLETFGLDRLRSAASLDDERAEASA